MAGKLRRFIARLTLTPQAGGSSVTLDLPRDFLYEGLLLRLSGLFTVAGGTTSGTLHDENPMSHLRRIIVEGTGGGQATQLKNYRGVHAYRFGHHLLIGEEPQAAPIVSAAVGGPTAFSVLIPLWFALPGAQVGPEMALRSILNGREFSKLTLQVDYGDDTDFVNGGDRAETLTSVFLDVYAMQATGVQLGAAPYRYIEQFLFRDALAAIATERQPSNKLPVGRIYRYLGLRVTNEVTNARQPVDDTLGALKLMVANSLIRRYSDFTEYAQANKSDNWVVQATNPGGLNALGSRNNPVVGYYLLDFAQGLLDTEKFPARGIGLDLLTDVAIATARQLDFCAGFLVRGAAPAAQ
jgi:hypothetical protein